MTQNFEAAGAIGREFLDAGLKSLASLSEGVRSLTMEAADYSWRTIEEGNAAAEKLAAAESAGEIIQAQGVCAREAYESLVAQATRMSGLWADMIRDTVKPFESVVRRAR